MPDPLSVGASIVSITVPTLHSIRLLLDDLNKIIDAPKAIQTLKDDVTGAEMALQSLQTVKDPEWEALGETVASQSKVAIKNCASACGTFRDGLQRWTRHSEEGTLSWQDRAKVGFFKERQIKAMSEQLQICKIAFNSAVGVATLYVYVIGSLKNGEDANYNCIGIAPSAILISLRRLERQFQRRRQRFPTLSRRQTRSWQK